VRWLGRRWFSCASMKSSWCKDGGTLSRTVSKRSDVQETETAVLSVLAACLEAVTRCGQLPQPQLEPPAWWFQQPATAHRFMLLRLLHVVDPFLLCFLSSVWMIKAIRIAANIDRSAQGRSLADASVVQYGSRFHRIVASNPLDLHRFSI
jgi:hypothetical protein